IRGSKGHYRRSIGQDRRCDDEGQYPERVGPEAVHPLPSLHPLGSVNQPAGVERLGKFGGFGPPMLAGGRVQRGRSLDGLGASSAALGAAVALTLHGGLWAHALASPENVRRHRTPWAHCTRPSFERVLVGNPRAENRRSGQSLAIPWSASASGDVLRWLINPEQIRADVARPLVAEGHLIRVPFSLFERKPALSLANPVSVVVVFGKSFG